MYKLQGICECLNLHPSLVIQIGSNGILSFGSAYNPFLNQELPVPDVYLVAPYWDDVDTRFGSGQISFEIHQSGYFLEEVSEFIRRRRSAVTFTGTWMLIVYWDAVHPFFGLFSTEVCCDVIINICGCFINSHDNVFAGEHISGNCDY